ncbi:UNVERIFIED_CONTAM: short-chain dehydrogenase/reductase, partial [Salmonella enterica subsp. enterica serovar Weltevreden]
MSAARVVLVTGASSGIGKGGAEYLAARGVLVYGTSRQAVWP